MPRKIEDLQKLINRLPGDNTEEKTVTWVHNLLAVAKQARSANDARCQKVLKYYKGGKHHWEDRVMPNYKAKITDNRCFSTVESVIPIITDNRPKAELAARDREDIDAVRTIKRVYDAKWDELNLEMLTTMVIRDAMIFGDGYLKVWFDPTLSDGLGDLRVTHVNPAYLYKDPESKDPLMDDAKYIIYHAREPLEKIKMWYPEKAEALDRQSVGILGTAVQDLAGDQIPGTHSERGTIAYDNADDEPSTTTTYRQFTESDKYLGKNQPYFTEMWIDDMSLEEVDEKYILYVDDGTDVEYSQKAHLKAEASGRDFEIVDGRDIGKVRYRRKYPHGRIITVCEKVLLDDRPSDYQHGKMPYVRFFDYLIPHETYAQGEIDQIIPLQDELNKRKSQIIDFFNICINPPIVLDRSCGLNTTKMTNRPGQIWPINGSTDKVKWLTPPPIPAAAFAHIDQINKDIDTVSGIHDVTQGRKPAGITAGIAIETLQEAAQTRLRLKTRGVEYSQKRLAELMVSIIDQYYQEPRVVRWQSNLPDVDFEYETVDFKDVQLKAGLPDVLIKPGSTMPTNKSIQRMQAIQLFEAGAIDRRALLDIFEFPNREEILARMGEGDITSMQSGGASIQGGVQGAPPT